MIWSIEFLEEAEKDMKKLDHSAQIQVLKGIKKVSQNPLSVREGGYGKPFRADISCPVQKIRQFSLYVVVFAGKTGIVICERRSRFTWMESKRRFHYGSEKDRLFLKQLRNEKKLTQEQLAEKFQITSRTVSRWETGSNMPDISMLLELADFYEVDIREIIDGERKSEQMNEELKETVIKVTDYTETNNARLLKRVRIIGITGVITILIAMVMDAGGLAVSPFWESVKRDLYAWTLGTLIANILYTTGWLKRISEKKDVSRKMRISGVVCAVIVIMSLILQAVL